MAEISATSLSHYVTQVDTQSLIAFMRAANEELIGAEDPRGKVWRFRGNNPNEYLCAGVRGEVGSLAWVMPGKILVPRQGLNDDYVEYDDAEMNDYGQPPGSEVPVAVVYKTVEEFCRTLAQPTSLKWVVMIPPLPTTDTKLSDYLK